MLRTAAPDSRIRVAQFRESDDVTAVTLVTPSFDSNSLGRTHVLWRLASRSGYKVRVVSAGGGELWEPLAGDPMVHDCQGVGRGLSRAELAHAVRRSDLVIAVKPVPASFGAVEPIASRWRIPLIVDIDDADLPRLSMARLIARQILKPRKYWGDTKVRSRVGRHSRLVSNPVLQNWHGGTVIPHARPETMRGAPHRNQDPVVAFVGTNRPHKGLPELRQAVERLQWAGVSLVVTDAAPVDARPWESWVGATTLAQGQEIVCNSDIVILPSHRTSWSEGQLPAKLVDAMMAGRAIGVSDIPPLTWAIGDAGRVIIPGDVDGIVDVIREYLNPRTRAQVGEAARRRAVSEFGEAVVSDRFRTACEAAIRAGNGGGRQ